MSLLSTDRDFTAFLESVRFVDVMWEGYATATRLERRLWELKVNKKASAA